MSISKITLNGVTQIDLTGDTVASDNMRSGVTAHGANGETVTGNIPSVGAATITPTKTEQIAVPAGRYTTGDVKIAPIPSQYIVPTGELEITDNGTVDVTQYASVTVDVQSEPEVVEEKDVNFIDYDGTLLHSYTASEFSELTDLPENPTHDGLTAIGWNWTKQQITDQLAANLTQPIFVGSMQEVTSGDTEIDVVLDDSEYLSPYLKVYLSANSNIAVDWGDNTTPDVIAVGEIETPDTQFDNVNYKVQYQLHEYSQTGSYTIRITVNSGTILFRSSSQVGNHGLLEIAPEPDVRNNIDPYNSGIISLRVGRSVKAGTYPFSGLKNLQSAVIPSSAISDTSTESMLQDCSSLNGFVLPAGKTKTGPAMINGCSALKYVSTPPSITSFGRWGFANCPSLKKITIPSGLTEIERNAFQYCGISGVVTIPIGINIIDQYTYERASNIESVIYKGDITGIGTYAFSNCKGLKSFNIEYSSESTNTIGSYAFSGCYRLSAIVPNGAKRIGSYAYNNAYSITELVIPPTVTYLESYAFAGNSQMRAYHMRPTTPPTLANKNAFSGISSNCVIYVPYSEDHSILNAYQTATNWSNYASYMQEEPQ